MAGIWVIGGANLDVMATSFKPLVKADSNPGKVTYSVGGVAHNVACNLAKMGCEVKFISAFSGDAFSEIVRQECIDNHIDLTYSQQFDDYSTSLYLALAEPNGEMSIAIADMDILSHLDMDKVVPLLQQMQEDDLAFIDTNLTEQ